MRPLAGVRVTLVSRSGDTPYSGMLPGVVAGTYTRDEAHIDLVRLCRHCNVRFIAAEVCGIDPVQRSLELVGRPALAWDVLSINTGSTPAPIPVDATAAESVIFTKPIDGFLRSFDLLLARVATSDTPMRVAVIGGGVAGVELTLAIERRLASGAATRGKADLVLIGADDEILPSHSAVVRRRLLAKLLSRGVAVHTGTRIEAIAGDRESTLSLKAQRGEPLQADAVICATQAMPAPWLAASELATDAEGFVAINEFLQSTSHPQVFAAGDVAGSLPYPRPKAGVYAVRQGRPLAENLRRYLIGRPLRRFEPQTRHLSLIGTGDGEAVASRGGLQLGGRLMWRWKDHIDRSFMRRFSVVDVDSRIGRVPEVMPTPDPGVLAVAEAQELTDPHGDGMRCAGCGSKTAADVLSMALGRLSITESADVLRGIGARDDAAVMRIPSGASLVLSVDAFRPLVEDPYLFGRITANHCLNDLFAMNARPAGALANVTLPSWTRAKLAEELYQMLAGALFEFEAVGASLVGGHTGEAAEASLGFTVTGSIDERVLFEKKGHRSGDRLVLSGPLGTGCLFAADMRAQAKASWVMTAIDVMCQSNAAAAACLAEHGAHAVTDVTGFGLAGHLLETLDGDALCVQLNRDAIPVLPGARELLARGWVSTLHASNRRWLEPHAEADVFGEEILFDPQTAGPLLASLAPDRAEACVLALQARGYRHAAIIGEVRGAAIGSPGGTSPIRSAARIRLAGLR